MIGSNAWYALMRRNLVYRKRNWYKSIMELVMPWFFIHILVKFKDVADSTEIFKPHVVPARFDSIPVQPLSFTDYVKAIQAKRECSLANGGINHEGINNEALNQLLDTFFPGNDISRFHITGMGGNGLGWQVPFVRCDSRLCEHDGQPAYDFCEYAVLALAPSESSDHTGKARVEAFKQYIYDRYPVLGLNEGTGSNVTVPFPHDFVRVFDSNEQIEAYIHHEDYGSVGREKIAHAVVFNGRVGNGEGLPEDQYQYTIRVNATNNNIAELSGHPGAHTTPNTAQKFKSYTRTDALSCVEEELSGAPMQGPMWTSCTGQYIYNGFLTTQRLVQDWIIIDSGARDEGYYVSEHGVQFMAFPTKEYTTAGFYQSLKIFVPLLLMLGLLYPFAHMISYIVEEKELRQKELLKMMSVTESDIGWSWFATSALFHTATALLAAHETTKLYDKSDSFFVASFWLIAFFSFVALSGFLASVCFHTTRSLLVGLLIVFSGYIISTSVDYQSGHSPWKIFFASLHPITAFFYGLLEMGHLEDVGVGVTWHTFYSTDNPSGYTFFSSMLFLIGDSFLWSIFAWYFNRVMVPRDQGQALHFLFPFQKAYWFAPTKATFEILDDVDDLLLSTPLSQDSDDGGHASSFPREPVSEALRQQAAQGRSIEIKNLCKVFPGDYKSTVAVDDLNLSIYNGQITALLGHNGAGKTTLINLLTGCIPPTSGYAMVAGKNSVTEMHEIREELGICLQHDCLFPQLTVREHVQFFSRLKGAYSAATSFREAEEQVDLTIRDVNLAEKSHTLAKNLSGGMKRKLSLANAFCGDSKIIFLDEPTSGMDPFSRRFTWDLIRNFKQGRCIILTTHFMDEADILGDRIAIMAEGRLQCVGSSLFLKKHYGVGYQLTIEKEAGTKSADVQVPSSASNESSIPQKQNTAESRKSAFSAAIDDKLRSIVMNEVNEATLLTNVGAEMSFQLPLETSYKFVPMLRQLDDEVRCGHISSYGVSMTTLDEVFLLVARGGLSSSNLEVSTSNAATENKSIELERDGLFTRHLQALFFKRAANFRRDRRAWCCTTILPTFFVVLGFFMLSFSEKYQNLEALPLDINDYNIKVETDPRNPLPFNSPDSSFPCQPGVCSYQVPMVREDLTKEFYFFCGMETHLMDNPKCSINDSSRVMSSIKNEGGILPVAEDTDSVYSSLVRFHNTSNMYASSQYGAILFSHEADSMTSSGHFFSELVTNQCKKSMLADKYIPPHECDNYGGIGYVVSYNFTAVHGAPLYQTLADEAIIRHALQRNDIKLKTTIHPLPLTETESSVNDKADSFDVWFNLLLSFPFIPGAFATFVVTEKQTKAKHLQMVSGVKPSAYWFSTFMWDVMNYQIPLWITFGLIYAFDVEVFITTEQGAVYGVLSLLVLYGPASASFAYCVSFFFTSASFCNIFLILSGFFLGMAGSIAEFVFNLLASTPMSMSSSFSKKARIIAWIGRLFPSFCLGNGLFNVINIDSLEKFHNKQLTVWTKEVLLWEVIFLIIQSICYLMLAILIDGLSNKPDIIAMGHKVFNIIRSRLNGGYTQCANDQSEDEEDVVLEEERVGRGDAENDMIVMKDLRKVYFNGKVAVDKVTLGIPPGECFGLLGINGAGKTTVMGILTAEFAPSEGDAALAGYSVSREPEKTRRRIGYCPQFDAHFMNMTGREHVELYASIKGVPKDLVKDAASDKLAEVGLSSVDSDRLSSQYSGGMKRRLSLACATIGQPEILFLDECTTGVDPIARREIWQMISDIVSEKKTSVILTTHLMEECEALCPRIGIMANGRLRCLGSAQRLKSKFGRGYQLEMKLSTIDEGTDNNEDYDEVLHSLARQKGDVHLEDGISSADYIFLHLHEVHCALQALSGDNRLSNMVSVENPNGFSVFRDATSATGVSLSDLANFATIELRICKIEEYFKERYPHGIFRERQDLKVRYEINIQDAGIADIFASVEENKVRLRLADYGVSQTSLEQVFNIHAAEAENNLLEGHSGSQRQVFALSDRAEDDMLIV